MRAINLRWILSLINLVSMLMPPIRLEKSWLDSSSFATYVSPQLLMTKLVLSFLRWLDPIAFIGDWSWLSVVTEISCGWRSIPDLWLRVCHLHHWTLFWLQIWILNERQLAHNLWFLLGLSSSLTKFWAVKGNFTVWSCLFIHFTCCVKKVYTLGHKLKWCLHLVRLLLFSLFNVDFWVNLSVI